MADVKATDPYSFVVDALKAIPEIITLIPDAEKFPALVVLAVLIIVVVLLLSNVAKNNHLVRLIFRYVFFGAGALCAMSFAYSAYSVVTIKAVSAEVQKGITKSGSETSEKPKGLQPIVGPGRVQELANSLVLQSWRLNPPPGIDEALAQLKLGNEQPAVEILNKYVLPTQKNDAARAATLRDIGLLEFYKDTKAALATYQQAADLDPGSWEAWGQIANLLERKGEHDKAAAAAQKVIDIGNSKSENNALGVGYAALGYIEANRGNIEPAKALLDNASGYFKIAGADMEYAATRNNIGRLQFYGERFDDARRSFEEALAIDTRINNARGIAADYAGLGQNSFQQPAKALEYFDKSIAANESVGDPHQAAMALSGKCDLYLASRDLEKARDACMRALSLEKQIDNVAAQAYVTGTLANIDHADGKQDTAVARYAEAMALAKDLPLMQSTLQRGLGKVHFENKKWIPALDAYRSALAIDTKFKQQGDMGIDQDWIGAIYQQLGQKDAACAVWKDAADSFAATKSQTRLAEVNQARADAKCK